MSNLNSRAMLGVIVAVAVVFAGIGWVAGQRIKSPAEAAAEQAPPEPSNITVPVELRELSQRLVVRGTVRSDEVTELDVTSATGETIVTRVVAEAGDELTEGDVAIEVAGRPIFVLEGRLPVFRSLIPTLEGPDVEQLEAALDRLGHDPGIIDGIFDGDTADAVEALYRDAGYKPAEPDEVDLGTLKRARDDVTQAQTAVNESQRLLNEVSAGPSESTRIQLDQAVRQAEDALADAEAGTAVKEATDARVAAERAATEATTALETANRRLDQGRSGTDPDTGGPITTEALAALEAEAQAAAAAKEEADTSLTAARAEEARAVRERDRVIEAAKVDLALAKATRTETLQVDASSARTALADARTRLTEARAELADTQARIDTQFPAGELRFLPSLPRTVQTLNAEAGERPTGPVMSITGSGSSITSAVAASDRRLISVGDAAVLEDDDLGIRADATIAFIAETPGGGEISSDRYLIRIEPNEDLPEEALGINFRITIPVTSSGGEVMAVPLAALSAAADGSARVEVEVTPGETRLVTVNPGLRAEGFVEIEAVDGDLDPGDRVVVGRDLVLPGSGDDDGDDEREDSGAEDSESDG